MQRRDFLRLLVDNSMALGGLSLFTALKSAGALEEWRALATCRIWAYYVPLMSYEDILEEFDGAHDLDRRVLFDEVVKKTNRISGKETDGTRNASLDIDQLLHADEYLRVKFWHDDFARASGRPGHSLYIFKRYLEELQVGAKVFAATEMYQGHFHVVLIQPPTAG